MGYYDDIAEGYEELHEAEQRKKIDLIARFLKPKQEDKLLDVGCGTGLTTEPWPCKRFGIDPAKKLIERARQKDRITYKIAPAENIPYPDNYFDYVISITAIQNFQDIEKGLKEIRRAGKKKFILTTLKNSSKTARIKELIEKIFSITNEIEEDKDIIFFQNI
ncbi:methyltransferase domain-containing protein [Candidatus Woesearchaeota archaeon]|nr:methyltransferase domain-containing protein [Candidatus Woesearchaeota archaeon]